MANWRKLLASCCLLAGFGLLTGCSSGITQNAYQSRSDVTGEQIVAFSRELIGSPYRYGGESPSGFDCSGLVRYVYRKVGITVPHSSRLLYQQARKVSLDQLQPGDLLFFNVSRNKISHVGIYTASGKFIHAPSSVKRVSMARLNNPYWEKRLVAAGRFH